MKLEYKNIVLFLLVMFMFWGCAFSDRVKYSSSIATSIVENRQLVVLNDTSLWRFPQQIEMADGFLVVLDEYDNLFFRIYSLDGKPLMGFGNKGQGPGELLWVRKFHISSDKKMMYVFDDMSKKLVEYNLDSLLLGKQVFREYFVDVKKMPQSKTPTILYDMIPLSEQSFLVKANHDELRYGIFDTTNKKITPIYHSFLEEGLGITSKEEIWSLFSNSTFTKLSPNKSKLVNVTYIGGIIEIFSVDGQRNDISLTNHSFIYEPVYGLAEGAIPPYVIHNEKTQFGFEDICVTDKMIYAVLHDVGEQLKPTFITIFDWEGNIQKRIEVGKRINKICVDECNGRMYLLVSNEENGYELDVMIL